MKPRASWVHPLAIVARWAVRLRLGRRAEDFTLRALERAARRRDRLSRGVPR